MLEKSCASLTSLNVTNCAVRSTLRKDAPCPVFGRYRGISRHISHWYMFWLQLTESETLCLRSAKPHCTVIVHKERVKWAGDNYDNRYRTLGS